jgi:hypothetical protein
MRRVIPVLAVIVALALIVIFYPGHVDRPVKDGTGPLAVLLDASVPAPEYHSPLDWWQTHHMDILNRGDLERIDCLYCHRPDTSCNNCHGYVGVETIAEAW